MRKNLSVFFLLVVLAAPAMAAQRNDDSIGQRGFFGRIARIVRALEDIVSGPPKP
ncbi:MAG: hypothetical protein JO093_15675 [Acidobacteria bacterium]|nr:hypothetical protein [Acidobacteriota bacterium]MBV9070960.1 hypothetical protein [Acidobacteriota bacterium]MBV9187054.1 hypothetical protein [Acidobacteriota bacterium]